MKEIEFNDYYELKKQFNKHGWLCVSEQEYFKHLSPFYIEEPKKILSSLDNFLIAFKECEVMNLN